MKKRILAMFLVLATLVGMLPLFALTAFAADTEYTESDYDKLYVKEGLLFQADFFDTNPYWGKTITLSNVSDSATNDFKQFVSYTVSESYGYLYLQDGTATTANGYLTLGSNGYGLMFPNNFTSKVPEVNSGLYGLTYQYIAAPLMQKSSGTLFGFAGVRVNYENLVYAYANGSASATIYLNNIAEAYSGPTAYTRTTAPDSAKLANGDVTEFTAYIRRSDDVSTGFLGASLTTGGTVNWTSNQHTVRFDTAISADAVPFKPLSVFYPGSVVLWHNGHQNAEAIYENNSFPFYSSVKSITANTGDFDTYDASTQYYMKGTIKSTSSSVKNTPFFTKDAEGDGYTLAFDVSNNSAPSFATGVTYYWIDQTTGENYYPVSLSSFDEIANGFVQLYTKEGDVYTAVKHQTYTVSAHNVTGDTGWYNNFSASYASRVYAMRLYSGELTADDMAQNHAADMIKYYKLDLYNLSLLNDASLAALGRELSDVTYLTDDELASSALYTQKRAELQALVNEKAALLYATQEYSAAIGNEQKKDVILLDFYCDFVGIEEFAKLPVSSLTSTITALAPYVTKMKEGTLDSADIAAAKAAFSTGMLADFAAIYDANERTEYTDYNNILITDSGVFLADFFSTNKYWNNTTVYRNYTYVHMAITPDGDANTLRKGDYVKLNDDGSMTIPSTAANAQLTAEEYHQYVEYRGTEEDPWLDESAATYPTVYGMPTRPLTAADAAALAAVPGVSFVDDAASFTVYCYVMQSGSSYYKYETTTPLTAIPSDIATAGVAVEAAVYTTISKADGTNDNTYSTVSEKIADGLYLYRERTVTLSRSGSEADGYTYAGTHRSKSAVMTFRHNAGAIYDAELIYDGEKYTNVRYFIVAKENYYKAADWQTGGILSGFLVSQDYRASANGGAGYFKDGYWYMPQVGGESNGHRSGLMYLQLSVTAGSPNTTTTWQLVSHPIDPAENYSYYDRGTSWAATGVGHFIIGGLRLATPFASVGDTDEVNMTFRGVTGRTSFPEAERVTFNFPAYTSSTLSIVTNRSNFGTDAVPLLKMYQDGEQKVLYKGAEVTSQTYSGGNYLLGWAKMSAWRMYAMRIYSDELTAAEQAQNHFYDVAKFYRLNVNSYDSMSDAEKAIVHDAMAEIDLELGMRVEEDTLYGRDYAREIAQAAYIAAETAVLKTRVAAYEDDAPVDETREGYLSFLALSLDYRFDVTEVMTASLPMASVFRDVNASSLAGMNAAEAQALVDEAYAYAIDQGRYEGGDGDEKRIAFLKSAYQYGVSVDELYAIPEMSHPAPEEVAFNEAFYDAVATALAASPSSPKTTLEALVSAQVTALYEKYGYTEYINEDFTAEDYNALYVKDALKYQFDFFQLNEYWGWVPETVNAWSSANSTIATGGNLFTDPHVVVYRENANSVMYVSGATKATITLQNGYVKYQKNGDSSGNLYVYNFTPYENDTWATWEMAIQLNAGLASHSFVFGDLRMAVSSGKIQGLQFNWGSIVPNGTSKVVENFTVASGTPTFAEFYNAANKTYTYSSDGNAALAITPVQNRPGVLGWTMNLHDPQEGDADYELGGWVYNQYSLGNSNYPRDSASQAMDAGGHDETISYAFFVNGQNLSGAGNAISGQNNSHPGANDLVFAGSTYIGYNSTTMDLDIYAMRFYDKQLSEAEQAQNHFADLAKFFRLDLTQYQNLTEEDKALIHNRFAYADTDGDGVADGLSFDSSREEVVAAFATAIYDIAYAPVLAGAEGGVSENYDTFLRAAALYTLDANTVSFLPAAVRETVLSQVLSGSGLYDVLTYPQSGAVLRKLLADALAPYMDASSDATFTQDEYNALYAQLDHLGLFLDFFSAKASDEPDTLNTNNTVYHVGDLGGVVKRGALQIQNHAGYYDDYGGSPVRYLKDGYLELAVPYSNIVVNAFTDETGASIYGGNASQPQLLHSNDYTFEIVTHQNTDRTVSASWLQLDALRASTRYSLADGTYRIEGIAWVDHDYRLSSGKWSWNVWSLGTDLNSATSLAAGLTGASVTYAPAYGDASKAHTITFRMDKTLESRIVYYELVKDADGNYTTAIIDEAAVKAIAGEDVKFPTTSEVVLAGAYGVPFGNEEGYAVGDVTKWVHAFAFDGTADYDILLDGTALAVGQDQVYSDGNSPMSLGSAYTGKIYSIRRYDIVLTDAELAQNHFVDLAKYYSLDITVYLLLNDAEKEALHTAMADLCIYDDAALVKMTYIKALYDCYYSKLLLDPLSASEYENAVSGMSGEEFVSAYNNLIEGLSKSGVDVSLLAKLPAAELAPLFGLANGFTSDFAGIDKALATGLLNDAMDGTMEMQMLVAELITFRGYQVKLGDSADDAVLAAGAIGLRSVYAFDKTALAALEAMGYSVSFGAKVTGTRATVTAPIYVNGVYETLPNGREAYYAAGQGGFTEDSFVLTLRFTNMEALATQLNSTVVFTYYVTVDDGNGNAVTFDFAAPSQTFGNEVTAGEVYTAFYNRAIEVDAVTKAAASAANGATYNSYTLNGIDLGQFKILYSENFGLAEALEVQAAIEAKTGITLPVVAEGASYVWNSATPYIYLVNHAKIASVNAEINTECGTDAVLGMMWSDSAQCLYLFNRSYVQTDNMGEYFAAYFNTLEDGAEFALKTFE